MSIYTAASANLADVQAKVNIAVNGDTVKVPAGTATWTAPLNVDAKAISIIGAGAANTVITNRSGIAVTWAGTGSNFFRLSGFRFNSLDNYNVIVVIKGPALSFRVDNCFFDKGDCAVCGNYVNQRGSGPTYGVIDHCTFLNMKRPAFPQDCRTTDHVVGGMTQYDGQSAWDTPPKPGSGEMVFWEDCLFKTDGNLTDINAQGALYGQYGGAACFRHNLCEGLLWVDAHGDNPSYSTHYYEIYDNEFKVTVGGQPSTIWMRGGIALVHNNTFIGGPTPFRMSVYWTTDTRRIGYQDRDTFYWGNKFGSASQAQQVVVSDSGQTPAGYSVANIRQGQEYWLAPPAAGQWCYPYTPYTYPHPLVSGAPEPPEPPQPVEPPLMEGLTFDAQDGAIDAPYVVEGGLVLQHVVTTNPGQGGRARYRVMIPAAGDYQVEMDVDASGSGADSLFVSFDAEPTTADQWTVSPLTDGVETRINPKAWTLTAGEHTLYVRGRESDCALETIAIFTETPEPPIPPEPGPITIADVDGLQEALDAKADKDHQHTIPESQTT